MRPKSMEVENLVITPSLAAKILETKNPSNRRIRSEHVRALAAEMSSGRWRDDLCPPLIFGRNDVLLDGQHRLLALIHAGATLRFLVRKTKDESSYALPIDIGARRGPGDLLLRESRISQVINTIAVVYQGSGCMKMSREVLAQWDAIIGDVVERLMADHGGAVRLMSAAPVRAGFCVATLTVARDLSEAQVFRVYDDLRGARLESSSLASLGAMFRRLLASGGEAGHIASTRRMWIVIQAFRRRSAEVIRCPSWGVMHEDLRELLEPLLRQGQRA